MKPVEICNCKGCGLQTACCIAPVKLSKSLFTHPPEIIQPHRNYVADNLQPLNHYNLYLLQLLRTYMCIGSHGDDQKSQFRISHLPLIHELTEDDVMI